MHKYDHIVVGAGASGLTLAMLLGLNGKRVLLLEKGPRLGGSMLRFQRRGIPFDTGVHFTGGLGRQGVLTQMLHVLGMAEAVRTGSDAVLPDIRFVFEDTGRSYEYPVGYWNAARALMDQFPQERDGLRRFFTMMEHVCRNTASMQLGSITEHSVPLQTDGISLAAVLDELFDDPELKTLLAGYALCHGTSPDEISFTKHSQVAYGLYDSVAFLDGGGQGLIDAFTRALARLDVDIRLSTALAECGPVEGKRVTQFVLTSGERVEADECLFTIHPHETLAVLPRAHLSKAFVSRVGEFEPSIGLFCVYAVVRDGVAPFSPAIDTRLPHSDLRALLRPTGPHDRPMAMLRRRETVRGQAHNVLALQEVSVPADVAAWSDSSTGRRPRDYYAYKRERAERLVHRALAAFPEYAGRLEALESASMLTFRDYLHSPWGCAYGIRQRLGQFSLFGRLPIRNLYVAGQSAALPGVLGAMMSSFIVARMTLGKPVYQSFIDGRLQG